MARKGPAERLAEQRAAQAAAQKKGKAVQVGGPSGGQKRRPPQVELPSPTPRQQRLRLTDEETPVGEPTKPYLAQPITAIPDELVGNTFLVAALKGKRPEFYLDYVGAASPTPGTMERLPKESVEAMEIPARAWTRQTKALANNMPVQDLICAGMAFQGQSHNFLVIANGKIQAMEEELDNLRLQAFKFRKTLEKEQYLRGVAESKLASAEADRDKYLTEVGLKEKELQAEVESKATLEAELTKAREMTAEAVKSTADLNELVKDTGGSLGSMEELKTTVIEEYKGSAQYNSNLNQTYVLAFKDVIEVIEKARPDFDVSFLRTDLAKYREE